MILLDATSATAAKAIAGNYYRKSGPVWGAFQATAILYAAISKLGAGLLRPLVPALRVADLPPTHVVSSEVAVVTGSNVGGIGFETAVHLVQRGYQVILTYLSQEKANQAIREIDERLAGCPDTNNNGKAVYCGTLDLADLQSVRDFGRRVSKKYPKIDILINNAGRNTSAKMKNGMDLCFHTNYLGHFLLTNELMETLLRSKAPRVVNVASVMHHFCDNDQKPHDADYWNRFARFDDNRKESSYSPSKLAMIYWTVALNQKFGSQGLTSIAVNPGAVNSNIWRDKPAYLRPLFRLLYLTNQQGCQTAVAAAIGRHYDSIYLQPYFQFTTKTPFPVTEMLGPFVGHQAVQPRLPRDGGRHAAQELWRVSEALVSS